MKSQFNLKASILQHCLLFGQWGKGGRWAERHTQSAWAWISHWTAHQEFLVLVTKCTHMQFGAHLCCRWTVAAGLCLCLGPILSLPSPPFQQPVRCRASAGAGDPSVQIQSANSHPWVKPAWESSALKLPQTEFQHSVIGYKHKHCCLGRPALTAGLEKVQGRFWEGKKCIMNDVWVFRQQDLVSESFPRFWKRRMDGHCSGWVRQLCSSPSTLSCSNIYCPNKQELPWCELSNQCL